MSADDFETGFERDQREKREERLPAWARHELKRLRSNLAGAEQELEEMRGEKGTSVFITNGLEEQPLPDDSMIRFRAKPADTPGWQEYFDCRLDGRGYLEVRSASHLVILPRGANSFLLRIEER